MSKCARCNRPLSDQGSIDRGMGPICAAKSAIDAAREQLWDEQPVLNDVGSLEEVGLVCRRLADGRLACNVPQIIKHHSPAGYDCGYGGSGPADLALNVMYLILPKQERTAEHLWNIVSGVMVSDDAWRLHQEFKWKFISAMPADGGRVAIEDIRAWAAQQLIRETA